VIPLNGMNGSDTLRQILLSRVTLVLAVALAVIAASIAAIAVSLNRESEARARAERAASDEAAAEAARKTAESEAQTAADNCRRAGLEAKAKADDLEREKLLRIRTAEERKASQANRLAQEAEAANAKALAAEAKLAHETEKLAAAKARDERVRAESELKAAEEKAKAAADALALERLKADKVLAEAKTLELGKIDFEQIQQTLLDWKRDLEDRERALRPEKTIADLAWAGGGEDSVVDEKGNLTKVVKAPYDPEKDPSLSLASRKLAEAERVARERRAEAAASRRSLIAPLERLYRASLRENRLSDAAFYRKSILTIVPDWEPGEAPAK